MLSMRIHFAKRLIWLLAVVVVSHPAIASNLHPEKYYQVAWCGEHKGQGEVVLADKTRADCVTSTHAVELDFGKKWAEAIGQSLYYSLQTGKRAGVVLIINGSGDRKYWIRLNSTIQHFGLPIDTWEVKAQ